ncbi:alcohol dehydrogenase [Sinomonas atrocyanea]|uniref:Alcohol dehydrogenase n=1 Tax=Sinomonas atrocyanea TaxID=37927 RepID=A0A127A4E8_9MICC|nr:NADP-dependent oxidoreductase [Sinomonas atrocyanea]AMM33664.1 alcohol dehydrogenase [Sinomonas atrocyanea]GEB63333.1 putative oxidoreductase [Sinomonas atrocyanea]GGG53401.1 putative oxidoreductase [Sinomonas atrocyanea]
MKAIAYDHFGSADVLELKDLPDPHPGSDSVLVQVKSASLNPVDYKVREGYLQGVIDAVFPVVPGWDVAGVVVKAGLDTPEFAVGDEILAYARKDVISGGTLAELVEVPVRTAARKPEGLSFEDAAALPLAGLTALQTVRRAGVAAGSTVLIHAAAGGVGSYATQLAVLAGARVVGTASEGNHDYLRSLGAEPIAYGEGLVEAARALAPEGFDVILDFVGKGALDTVPQLLRAGGTAASITDPAARDEYGGQYVWVRPDAADLAELAQLAADGRLKVEVADLVELAQAADAYRTLEGGHVRGKLVVRP